MFQVAGSFWTQAFVCLAVSFSLVTLITPFIIRVASQQGWLDRPGFRKIHSTPLPRLGGVGIYAATWGAWGVFVLLNPNQVPYEFVRPFWAIFWGSTLVWCLGLYDDLRGTNAWQKLIFQIIAAAVVTHEGMGIRLIHNPFHGDFTLHSEAFVWILTVSWIVIVTNSINLIDGLDGLATGVCLITAGTIYFISRGLGSPHLPFFSLCVAGSCAGFLIFNFTPARIFLGDSGSLFLGFILACLSILGTTKRSTAIVMFGPPLILALPVADALFAVVRRFLRNVQTGKLTDFTMSQISQNVFIRFREVFRADQEHIHHGLLKIGLSHRRAVILLYGVTALLGVTAYRTAVDDHLKGTAVVFLVLSGGIFWLRYQVTRGDKS